MRGMDNLCIKLPARLGVRLEVELVAMLATAADHSARNHLRHLADGFRIVPGSLTDSYVTTLVSNDTGIYLLGFKSACTAASAAAEKLFLLIYIEVLERYVVNQKSGH